MDHITLDAHAKINLFLDVTGLRPDGYHEISTVMIPVSLCDKVSVKKSCSCITVNCDTAVVSRQEDNIAYKAAQLFFDTIGICGGAKIDIEKHIPAQAGLAGGSTDAAAVLTALNILYETDLDEKRLCEMGAKLGADVPFCIVGRAMYACGKGYDFTPVCTMPRCYIVIAKDGEGVSTKEAYAAIDALGGGCHADCSSLFKALDSGRISEVCSSLFNLFEQVVLPERPRAKALRELLGQSGAICARMSGSGPSVFGIFEDEEQARAACELLLSHGIDAHVCTPV